MPRYAAGRVARLLNEDAQSVKGAKILVLGVAYKPGVGDFRDSPSLDIMHLLTEDGARISYHDPHVPKVSVGGRVWKNRPLSDAAVREADCVLILTAHPGLDYARIVRLSRRVFDARNATAGLAGRVERL
jgi:UDP-N-acetyl-D-glucosamine dehydrogenase